MQPEHPRLYSILGYRYCGLLLGLVEPEDGAGLDRITATPEAAERLQEALARAMQMLESVKESRFLLDVALNHLTLGRARFGLALMSARGFSQDTERIRAAEYLNRAVEGLRQAGQEDYLPSSLLSRAAFRRLSFDFIGAANDLSEVLEIVERGPMRLFECDAHLELARLCRDQGQLDQARCHVERARELVEQTGYGRREREVSYLIREIAR